MLGQLSCGFSLSRSPRLVWPHHRGLKIFWGSSEERECGPASPGKAQLSWGLELSFRSLALVSRVSLALVPHAGYAEVSEGRQAVR